MVDWTQKFRSQYEYAREYLDADHYHKEWQNLVRMLQKMMKEDGFDAGEAASLETLRRNVRAGMRTEHGEDENILQAVGWSGEAPVSDENKLRAAALKFLKHIYLLKQYGSCNVWVHSLPQDFLNWAYVHLWSQTSTNALKSQLRADNEHFSEAQKRYLADSTHHALGWCHKASLVLAEATDAVSSKHHNSRALVRRWFAEPGLPDATLDSYIGKLTDGFKIVTARLNKGHLIFTDYAPLRSATTVDEIRFLQSEAFTFASFGEGLDVVYIEKSFFRGDNVLQGRANWIRIIVHELTHLAAGTIDVQKGQVRYAWYGIGPHAGYTGSDCVRNAENWAFFAADCAGALTEAERERALRML